MYLRADEASLLVINYSHPMPSGASGLLSYFWFHRLCLILWNGPWLKSNKSSFNFDILE